MATALGLLHTITLTLRNTCLHAAPLRAHPSTRTVQTTRHLQLNCIPRPLYRGRSQRYRQPGGSGMLNKFQKHVWWCGDWLVVKCEYVVFRLRRADPIHNVGRIHEDPITMPCSRKLRRQESILVRWKREWIKRERKKKTNNVEYKSMCLLQTC